MKYLESTYVPVVNEARILDEREATMEEKVEEYSLHPPLALIFVFFLSLFLFIPRRVTKRMKNKGQVGDKCWW